MTKIVITGANKGIGYFLVENLLRSGNESLLPSSAFYR